MDSRHLDCHSCDYQAKNLIERKANILDKVRVLSLSVNHWFARKIHAKFGAMIQTLEAIVNEEGEISLLTEVRLPKSRRALVTILDEEPKLPIAPQKEKLRAVFKKMHSVKMFSNIEDPKIWQKALRDEWE